jgi:Class II Aldolase and Adducin N-terminal domain
MPPRARATQINSEGQRRKRRGHPGRSRGIPLIRPKTSAAETRRTSEDLEPAPSRSRAARVVAYDLGGNWLQCEGLTIASSESLTHAAVYESAPEVRAIIHGHSLKLWAALLGQVPTTSEAVDYGPPEMAAEVRRLFEMTDVRKRRIAMAGHEGGMVSFGGDLEEAFAVVNGFG